jgi:hypothetical protein
MQPLDFNLVATLSRPDAPACAYIMSADDKIQRSS